MVNLRWGKGVKRDVYTVEECLECKANDKRLFQPGDYVYKEAGKCHHCQGMKSITMIYCETVKQKPRAFLAVIRGSPGRRGKEGKVIQWV